MKRLPLLLSRNQLVTIYKRFVKSHLDYADKIYDKPFNDSSKEKLDKIQYSEALIISGAIKGTSPERLYKELGLESHCDRRWYRKLVFFDKVVKGLAPSYLLPDNERTYNTRSSLRNTIKHLPRRYQLFAHLLCLVLSTVLGIIFHIYCFIVSFIASACNNP